MSGFEGGVEVEVSGRGAAARHPGGAAGPERWRSQPKRYTRAVKRAFDLVVATCALIAFAPVMAVAMALVRITMGSPVIFSQLRPGRDEVLFRLYKIRTMLDLRDPVTGEPLPDHERLTPLGALLRRTSIDELPQLWNVVRGDMSLVGPRPLYRKYLDWYTERERLRHSVRPGITGWAQVNGRNTLSWDERLERDAWYAQNHSLTLDLRILAATVRDVARGAGVRQQALPDLSDERARKADDRRSRPDEA